METKEKNNTGIKLERVLGIILLIPPIVGIILFLLNLVNDDLGNILEMRNLSTVWVGKTGSSGEGGYTSATPIYLGLMAIAGALLLKGTDKK